jgi:hypothetical protein
MRDSRYYAERANYWLFSDRIPVTKSVIVTGVLTFLVFVFTGGGLAKLLSFSSVGVFTAPWTLATYPLQGTFEPVALLFSSYWMWVACGTLERSWGSRVFGIYFFVMSAITAVGLLVATTVAGVPTHAAGLWLPLAGATIAFAMQNPEQQILFFFIIPMKLKYLALLDVLLVMVSFARPNPLVGVFALAGCAVSYWYVRQGRSPDFGTPRQSRQGDVVRVYDKRGFLSRLNPFRAIRDWRERKRLRDFFDKSGFGE